MSEFGGIGGEGGLAHGERVCAGCGQRFFSRGSERCAECDRRLWKTQQARRWRIVLLAIIGCGASFAWLLFRMVGGR